MTGPDFESTVKLMILLICLAAFVGGSAIASLLWWAFS